jgi:putative transcriptional regulator
MPILKLNDDPTMGDAADDRPLSAADLKRMRRTPQVKVIRRALGLTQEQFSDRYHIPLGTLRDWEQGRSEPDQPARAYLRVIAAEPAVTAQALSRTAA